MFNSNEEYINPRIDKLKTNGYIIKPIDTLDNVTNVSNIQYIIKEKLNYNIYYCGNNFNLIKLDDETFMIKINEIYNKRKNVII